MVSGIPAIGDIVKHWRPVYQRMAEECVVNYGATKRNTGYGYRYRQPLANDLKYYKNWAMAYVMDGKQPICKAITENL
jgi:hypothetical protein